MAARSREYGAAHWDAGQVVHPEDRLDVVQCPALDHEFGPLEHLFAGLEEHPHPAAKLVPARHELLHDAQAYGCVDVVAAGVAAPRDLAAELHVREIFDGEGVDVDAHGDGGAGVSAFDLGDDSYVGADGCCRAQGLAVRADEPGSFVSVHA